MSGLVIVFANSYLLIVWWADNNIYVFRKSFYDTKAL